MDVQMVVQMVDSWVATMAWLWVVQMVGWKVDLWGASLVV
jgi:hypothetical protein